MAGFITTQTVHQQKDIIIDAFGREFFEFCLTTDAKTFLEALTAFGALQAAA
jgi:hypothetical protein